MTSSAPTTTEQTLYHSTPIRTFAIPRPDIPEPNRLAPEDAYLAHSPPRRGRQRSPLGLSANEGPSAVIAEPRRKRNKDRHRSSSGRKTWKKLLWVKQSFPDNYTDEETFLDHLQRNPRLQPYEFWPLVASSTVIVQHVCAVCIFLCCFTAIFFERISPVMVVGWGSSCTILGWILWDIWVSREAALQAALPGSPPEYAGDSGSTSTVSLAKSALQKDVPGFAKSISDAESNPTSKQTQQTCFNPQALPISPVDANGKGDASSDPYSNLKPVPSERSRRRLETIKSAILIYCALLGLSPILKSLTSSTSSDSIWALSCWLICINIFFFDYGGGIGAKYVLNYEIGYHMLRICRFPASLSTNAGLMASTVLASRLTSTTHVFSIMLFSIEVFGLFPVFRRHLRHVSWTAHIILTILLVAGAGGSVGITISGGTWKAAFLGILFGGLLIWFAVGICSWWLIGLQKYKNEIHGPWDPARPIIRRRWD
ncbi:GPI2-domain-containing protein [Aulographum hederae CBS 113979]|uniref:GPI2-domain-containing protein n=1 Tax=Aulographum hederae CBS 113979 TaxID=1176131 RepID=A0A6G1GSD7_9PEZI|nr:GPI2-domain-containing protein [Aulographum hederae CBS 113979]